MTILQNMMQKERELQAQFDLLSQKISRLRTAFVIETDPADKFKLEKQLEEAEAERELLEQQLTQLQHRLETYNMQVTSEISAIEVPPVDSKEQFANLHNQIVEFLTSLPNIQDKNERRALIYSAGLDKALVNQLVFEGPTAQCFQLLVHTLVSYGKQEDGRDPLIALLESAKNKVGQDRKEVCKKLIHQLQTSEHLASKIPADQIGNPTEPKIDVHLKKLREVGDVTGVDAYEEPDGSTTATIEDVKDAKNVTGVKLKNVRLSRQPEEE